MPELSEEEVFANDVDPLDGIREIRKAEGVAEEDLPVSDSDTPSDEGVQEEDGKDELDNLQESENAAPETDTNEDNTGDDIGDDLPAGDVETDLGEEGEKDELDESTDTDTDTDDAPVVKRTFKADGKEFEFTEQEMLDQFEVVFGQAMNFTQKTQKIAPYRKMISALEEEGITSDQLNVAIDALKGNPEALKTLMTANKIDAFDLTNNEEDAESPYVPTEYGQNEAQLAINEITNNISSDPEYKITVDVVDRQWDDSSRQALSSNPNMIQGLHNDIKSGVYDKVAPVALKMKLYDGNTKSDLEYYMLAGDQVLSEEKQNSANVEKTVAEMNEKAQGADEKFDQASSEAQRKRSAAPTRGRTDRKGVIDYLDDDDEKFDAWYKNLQAQN